MILNGCHHFFEELYLPKGVMAQLAQLTVSREEFRSKLAERFNQGVELLKRVEAIHSENELVELEKAYKSWNSYNKDYLLQSFSDGDAKYPREYENAGITAGVGPSHIGWPPPNRTMQRISTLLERFQEKTDCIQRIIERIELMNEADSQQFEIPVHSSVTSVTSDQSCDYAIITALEEDEMESFLPMIEVEGTIPNEKQLIQFGHLKSLPTKKIAFASQQATGMIDASILATEMLVLFRPKFLIMIGVLGGKPGGVKIGDVVVATKVFTIDKGKITDLGFQKEIEAGSTENAYVTKFKRRKQEILTFIKVGDPLKNQNVEIHFGPIGCVRQVIDLEGFFEESITSEDRKAIALEMESYGIQRSCELVNNGHTIPLIIKAAMDNTKDKVDGAKQWAALNSAKFVQFILENDLI